MLIYADSEALIGALQEAVELEVSLMLQYLYAAYSIPNYATGQECVRQGIWTPEILELMCGDSDQRLPRGIRGILLSVANEEMQHFLLANNLLLAVGGGFHIGRPDFSGQRLGHRLSTEARLAPLSVSALERFIGFEAPHRGTADDGSVSVLYARIRNTLIAHPEHILVRPGSVGGEHHLYLSKTLNKHHPDYHCQVDDLTTALFALDAMTEQGEGGPQTSESFLDSHWQRFSRVRDSLDDAQQRHGEIACYPVVTNPSTRDRAGMTRITNADTLTVMYIFNVCYELCMQLMMQHFCLHPRGTLRRSKLMNASIDVMAYMLGPLANLLMSLDSGVPGRTAGPSFELKNDVRFIPDQEVAQRHMARRFGEVAALAEAHPRVPRDVTLLLHQYANYSSTLT